MARHEELVWSLASEAYYFADYARQSDVHRPVFTTKRAPARAADIALAARGAFPQPGVGGNNGFQSGPVAARMADVARLGSVMSTVWLLTYPSHTVQAAYNPIGAAYAAAHARKHLVLRMLLAAPGPPREPTLLRAAHLWQGVVAAGDLRSMQWVLAALAAQEGADFQLPLGQLRRAVLASLSAGNGLEVFQYWTGAGASRGKRAGRKLQFTARQWERLLGARGVSDRDIDVLFSALLDEGCWRSARPPNGGGATAPDAGSAAAGSNELLQEPTLLTRVAGLYRQVRRVVGGVTLAGLHTPLRHPQNPFHVRDATKALGCATLWPKDLTEVFGGNKLAWLDASESDMLARHATGSISSAEALRHAACGGILDAMGSLVQLMRGNGEVAEHLHKCKPLHSWLVRFAVSRRSGADRDRSLFPLGGSGATAANSDAAVQTLLSLASADLPGSAETVILLSGSEPALPTILLLMSLTAGTLECVHTVARASSHPALGSGMGCILPLLANTLRHQLPTAQSDALSAFLEWALHRPLGNGRRFSVLDANDGPMLQFSWARDFFGQVPDAGARYMRSQAQMQAEGAHKDLLDGSSMSAQRHCLEPHPMFRQVFMFITDYKVARSGSRLQVHPDGSLRLHLPAYILQTGEPSQLWMSEVQVHCMLQLLQIALQDCGLGLEMNAHLSDGSVRFRDTADVWREVSAHIPAELWPAGSARKQFRLWKSQRHHLRWAIVQSRRQCKQA